MQEVFLNFFGIFSKNGLESLYSAKKSLLKVYGKV